MPTQPITKPSPTAASVAAPGARPVSAFIEKHFLHFNAAALVDAAKGYKEHLGKGRKMMITLAGAIDMAWVTRATVAALYEWAVVPLGVSSGRFELTLADSRVFTVAFRHGETPVEAEPVAGFPARSDDDLYRLTLRLLEL